MIVFSLLLIVGAAVLLVTGLWQSSSPLLSGSIGASLLAAIVLVVGTRRAGRAAESSVPHREPARGTWRQSGAVNRSAAHRAEPEPEAGGAGGQGSTGSPTVSIPLQGTSGRGTVAVTTAGGGSTGTSTGTGSTRPEDTAAQAVTGAPGGYLDDEDPPDEPAPQQVSAADAARVGRMNTEVLVVDGRPRYHLPGCVHLLARESEPLPVSEALELGFTPCSLCEPDSALLADARRV